MNPGFSCNTTRLHDMDSSYADAADNYSAIPSWSDSLRINFIARNEGSTRCCRMGARRSLMAETPDVGGNRRRLDLGELCAAHRWHRTAVLLGLRNTVGDDL